MPNDNSIDNFLDEIKKGKAQKDVEDYLMKQLSTKQSKRLNEIMQSEEAMNELLNTPQAQNLLKKLIGEDDGQHK